MTIEIDFSYVIDGFYHSVNYYRSETQMNPESMPAATATGITGLTYTDTTATKGINYYVRFGSVRSGIEKVSEEIRVLAGTAWTPANLANPSKLWLSAEDVVVDSSNRISEATDLSGNNYHFTQTIDNLKPLLVVDTTLNRPVFKFDGIDDYMNNGNANNISKNISYLWSLAIHKKNADVAGTNTILRYVVGVSPYRSGRFAHYASTSSKAMTGLGTRRLDTDTFVGNYDTVETGTEWTISLAYQNYNQASSLVVVNGVGYTLSPAGTTGLTSNTSPSGANAWLGTERAETGFLDGCIAEVVSGNTELTQADIDKLFGWAAHKYGLTENLPSGHPYKTNPPVV